jgi:ribonuclease J
VAAALANQPDLLLADEVTGELDTATADQVMEVMMDAWRQRGLTVLLVTHNHDVAERAQHRLRLVDGAVTQVTTAPSVRPRTGTSAPHPQQPKPAPRRPVQAAEPRPQAAANGTRLTFLNLGNPTGLKFSVEWEGFRAIFDFGLEHAPGRAPFSMGLDPRPGRELQDLIAVGAAPRLEGVYDAWDGRTGVFISHLHLDHTSLVPFLHPDVPLYYPAAMEPLRAAAAACGEVPWRRPAGIAVPDRHVIRGPGIEVRFQAVDHDLPGATGFFIQTPDLTIAYTGDHRWHGLHPELTEAFAESVRGVDVLIQEGVSLGFQPTASRLGEQPAPPQLSEAEVLDGFERVLAETAGLVVVNLLGMNRERVAGLAEACARTGRRLLMEPDSATLAGWDGVLDDVEQVRDDPRGHCVQLKFKSLPTLIDLAPPPGSVYVHSNGSPLGTYDPRWAVMESWCSRLGLELVRLSSSGHSRPEDIVHMVETVRPGLVIPVHSQAPEALDVPGVPRLLAVTDRAYSAEELFSLARSGKGSLAPPRSQRPRASGPSIIRTARTRLLKR